MLNASVFSRTLTPGLLFLPVFTVYNLWFTLVFTVRHPVSANVYSIFYCQYIVNTTVYSRILTSGHLLLPMFTVLPMVYTSVYSKTLTSGLLFLSVFTDSLFSVVNTTVYCRILTSGLLFLLLVQGHSSALGARLHILLPILLILSHHHRRILLCYNRKHSTGFTDKIQRPLTGC